MEGLNKAEDFDDFFDTPGRSIHDGGLSDDSQTGIHTATYSKHDRHQRKSVSSETDGSASESLTENAKKKRNRSPPESDLSRSEGGSATSTSSRSSRRFRSERRESNQSEKERRSSSSSRSTSPRDSLSGRRSRRERKDSNKSKAEKNKLEYPNSRGENLSSGDSRSGKNVRIERRDSKSNAEEKLGSFDSHWRESLSSTCSRDSRSGKNSLRENKRSCLEKPTSSTHAGKYVNKPKKRSESSSSVTSSSCSDDSDNSDREQCFITNKVAEVKQQAWVKDSGDSSAHRYSIERPKTAKRMCDSDSDMTDVSPISSPRDGFLNGHGENTSHSRSHEPKSVHFKKYKPVSLNEETTAHRDYADNGNAIDLNILMKAVSEIEKEKRVKAQTRRVMFEPVQAKSCGKTNYTFSCDDTDRIEKENKRLLQEILKCMHSNSEKRQQKVADPSIKRSTLTASAINRRRDQKRIENENLVSICSFY